MLVSGSYFPVLGIQPALGRLLSPADDRAVGESKVVVLSHAFWQTRFDASPNVLNDTLIVNGQSLTIVGVAPRGFDGTTLGVRPEVFVPITLRGLMSPGFERFREPAHLLGVRVRAAETGRVDRRSPRRHEREIQRDPQRRRGVAPDGHERPDARAVQSEDARPRAGRARTELGAPRGRGRR